MAPSNGEVAPPREPSGRWQRTGYLALAASGLVLATAFGALAQVTTGGEDRAAADGDETSRIENAGNDGDTTELDQPAPGATTEMVDGKPVPVETSTSASGTSTTISIGPDGTPTTVVTTTDYQRPPSSAKDDQSDDPGTDDPSDGGDGSDGGSGDDGSGDGDGGDGGDGDGSGGDDGSGDGGGDGDGSGDGDGGDGGRQRRRRNHHHGRLEHLEPVAPRRTLSARRGSGGVCAGSAGRSRTTGPTGTVRAVHAESGSTDQADTVHVPAAANDRHGACQGTRVRVAVQRARVGTGWIVDGTHPGERTPDMTSPARRCCESCASRTKPGCKTY
ncbi:hypothetical protein GCM10009676_26970 [Prauserella halophila]|uniref:Uncharacterized protein n=1 Tax=Prauserella halophila TaxID=185641 RepID=A0ABP4H131_9PSEU